MHYAWTIVALVFTTQFVANAVGFYAFGVVIPSVADAFDVSRQDASMIPFAFSWAGAVLVRCSGAP